MGADFFFSSDLLKAIVKEHSKVLYHLVSFQESTFAKGGNVNMWRCSALVHLHVFQCKGGRGFESKPGTNVFGQEPNLQSLSAQP